MRHFALAVFLIGLVPNVAQAQSAPCGGPFDTWLAAFRQEALSKGITSRTFAEAAPLMKMDAAVLSKDRGQQVFTQTFTEFAARMAEGYRLPQSRERNRPR
jgi:membrane-bound lytic murein transglycosylase B